MSESFEINEVETAALAPVPFGGGNFYQQLSRYIGESVTIFTTSGGQSGSGFSGVLTLVTPEYVRLVTSVGMPPECSLGSGCDFYYGSGYGGGYGGGYGYGGFGPGGPGRYPRRYSPLGSVVDIPIARIASFAHNTL